MLVLEMDQVGDYRSIGRCDDLSCSAGAPSCSKCSRVHLGTAQRWTMADPNRGIAETRRPVVMLLQEWVFTNRDGYSQEGFAAILALRTSRSRGARSQWLCQQSE